MMPFLENVNARCVKKFLSGRKKEIENLLLLEKPQTGQIHTLRKSIKELYYLQKIFQPRNKRLAIANEFQKLLGLWHDYHVISNDLLSDARNHEWRPEEIKAIMAIQKKITGRAAQLFNTIESEKAKQFEISSIV